VLIKSKYFALFFAILLFSIVIFIYYFFYTPKISNLVINEVVTKNSNIIADEDGDYSGWIEIWNTTNNNISTENVYLLVGDQKWNFPNQNIAPDGTLVIWTSGKNKTNSTGNPHTNFTLTKDAATVSLLSKTNNTIRDSITIPDLDYNISYGRDFKQKSEFCYFAYPTPNEANSRDCFSNLKLGAPKFSHDAGVYEESFNLKITPENKNRKVIYTLDGSFPDLERNPESTMIYENPIEIKATNNSTILSSKWYATENSTYPQRSKNLIPYSGTVIRAKTEFSAENSAFFVFSTMGKITLPIISLIMENDYLIDPELGIYTPGNDYEDYLDSAEYDESLKINFPANFSNRGVDWERPFAIDTKNAVVFHYCIESKCLNQNIGVRVHGGATRSNPMKSLRLYAREEYGKPYFQAQFFKNQQVAKFKRLILRSSGQDWGVTMLASGTYHKIAEAFNVDTQNYQPTVLFINGEYWGIHNLRERHDRYYFSQKYNVKSNNVTVIDGYFNLQEGSSETAEEYRDFIKSLAQFDYGDPVAIKKIQDNIDLSNYFDYMILQTFFAPYDWPTHNVKLWRLEKADRNMQSDFTKWRWMTTDLDLAGHLTVDHNVGVSSYEYFVERIESTEFTVRNAINYDENQDAGVSLILTHILSNSKTREAFLDRYQQMLKGPLSSSEMIDILILHSEAIRPEMERHIQRWGYPRSTQVWESYLDELEKFLRTRSEFMNDLIQEKYLNAS